MTNWKRYRKTIAATIGAVATWGVTASADGIYDQPELWGLLLALGTIFGVYQVRNVRELANNE